MYVVLIMIDSVIDGVSHGLGNDEMSVQREIVFMTIQISILLPTFSIACILPVSRHRNLSDTMTHGVIRLPVTDHPHIYGTVPVAHWM